MSSLRVHLILLVVVTVGGGCDLTPDRKHNGPSGSARNQQLAAELTQKATAFIVSDPDKALQLLREAVEADLFHGPAHNNIGVLLLERGQLYEAAEEFDWARRLMPGHPDPRINLGISLERGGRVDDALEAYASALEVYPEHLPSMQALVRLQVRAGVHDAQTRDLLHQVVQRGDEPWRQWARSQIARLPEHAPAVINQHQ